MKGKKFLLVLVILLATVILFTGCQKDKNSAGAKKGYKVAFFVKTLTNEPFMVMLSDRCRDLLKERGHDFVIFSAGDQTSVATQTNQLEDAINSGEYDAFIMVPLDSNAVLPGLQKAKDKGIPVCVVDTPLPEGSENLILSFVGTENYSATVNAAKYVIEQMGPGKAAVIRGISGAKSLDERLRGYYDAVKGTNVEIVADQPGNNTNAGAMQAMENILQSNPEITCVFSVTDVMADGILQALDNAGRSNMFFCSFDGSKNATGLVVEGRITATAGQYPRMMGEKAVEYILGYLDGTLVESDIPKNVDSGSLVINQSNARDWYNNNAF
jgi:ribose transport system substrate-binding protein